MVEARKVEIGSGESSSYLNSYLLYFIVKWFIVKKNYCICTAG